jgi:FKBP-type peptidyl-prolyl cis-trans isomerase 2
MDVATLRRYEKFAIPFDRAYGERLRRLLDREEYRVFRDVIEYMLEKKIRLEQECVEIEVKDL